MKKTITAVILCVALLLGACIFTSYAAGRGDMNIMETSDSIVYAPGVFDLYVPSDPDVASYQWCSRVGYDGSWLPIEDNERYSGTHTNHFSFLTADGFANEDWSNLRWCCLITWSDGYQEYSSSQDMIIYPYADLLRHLDSDGVKIAGFRVSGKSAKDQIGDVQYYEVFAGEGINMSLTTGLIPAYYYQSSEVEVRSEYYITEDGNTVLFDPAYGPYYPHVTGRGAIHAKGDLVLYVNGQRMDVIDSRTIVVDVLTPLGSSEGVARENLQIKADQYSQSATVGYAASGSRVVVLQESGNWKKVVAGGYIGWVPSGSLRIFEKVESVYISIAEPSDAAGPDRQPLFENVGCGIKPGEDSVEWLRADGTLLKASDRFAAGNTYKVRFWVKADSGMMFPLQSDGRTPSVKAFVNGRQAEVSRAYEQDPNEVIWVTYTFTHVHDPKKVTQKNPTCTEPGKLTYYHCSCGMYFEDYQAKVAIDDPNWGIIPARGHKVSSWMSNGSEHYRFCERRECGAVIEGSTGAHYGGRADCTHAAVCDVCGLAYGSKTDHVPGPAATETTPQTCTVCGTVLANPVDHTHSPVEVATVEPTCTESGLDTYIYCQTCGKLFRGSEGEVFEIGSKDELVIAPLGHEVSENWKTDLQFHWRFCTRCGADLEETKMLHSDTNDDGRCDDCGYVIKAAGSQTEPKPPAGTEQNTNAGQNTVPGQNTDPGQNTNAGLNTDIQPALRPAEGLPISPVALALIALGGVVAGALIAVLIKSAAEKKEKSKTSDKQ